MVKTLIINARSSPCATLTITAAVSEMVLATNKNTLQYFLVNSLLTEAHEVVYRLPNLHRLWVIIEGPTSLPTVELPNLTKTDVECDHDDHWWQGFHGGTLGRLVIVALCSESESNGGFLEVFRRVGLTTSTCVTLLTFRFYTLHPWRKFNRSLLPSMQLKEFAIDFPCDHGFSSTMDDNIITDIAQAMSKPETL